jgi:glycosyltransferase involved in cell wall biosynthesis
MRIYDQVAVVIPACNERSSLPGCLRATLTAALCVPIPVVIVVVLDASDDGSAELAGQYGPDVHFISVDVRDVGAARAVGFGYARSLYGHGAECWYATTDAHRRVDPGWLVRQLEVGADMVLGVEHIHGANMGFSARAYWRVGGFRSLSSGADVDLVTRFEAAGYHVHRDTELSVITSARAQSRAPRWFARRLGDHRLDESRRTATGGSA